jgi:ribosomal protein S14
MEVLPPRMSIGFGDEQCRRPGRGSDECTYTVGLNGDTEFECRSAAWDTAQFRRDEESRRSLRQVAGPDHVVGVRFADWRRQ